MKTRIAVSLLTLGFCDFCLSGPLTEAQVTKIINKVQVVDPANGVHSASLQETIKDQIELKTGVKSRSELLFQDNTLTRIGPETSFSFKAGTRDMSLERGTMLLQVPKGLGGAKIRTAAVTAAITGTTIMMEYVPKKHIKVLVLEGSLRLSPNGRIGESVVLTPGRMVLMRPDAKKIPDPVSVDLKRIVSTSSLVNMSKTGEPPLPSSSLIDKEIAQQTRDKQNANLFETGLAIRGVGTVAMNNAGNVVDILARSEQRRGFLPAVTAPSAVTSSTPAATASTDDSSIAVNNSDPLPTSVPAATPIGPAGAATPIPDSATLVPPPEATPPPLIVALPTPVPTPSIAPVPVPEPSIAPTPSLVRVPVPEPSVAPTPSLVRVPVPEPSVAPTPSLVRIPLPAPTPPPIVNHEDGHGAGSRGDHNGDGHRDNGHPH